MVLVALSALIKNPLIADNVFPSKAYTKKQYSCNCFDSPSALLRGSSLISFYLSKRILIDHLSFNGFIQKVVFYFVFLII
jgi:hypothetical protein